MRNYFLFILLVLCSVISEGFAQNHADSIVVKKGFGTTFWQSGENLRPKQLLEVTRTNPQAYEEMKIAKKKL